LTTDTDRIRQELLVRRCQNGERRALEELVRTWEKRLFFYIRRLLPDEQDAWDTLQETWLKALRGLHTLRDPDTLPMWLYRIARNTAMGRLRKQYQDRALVEEVGSRMESEPEPDFTFADAEQVRRELSGLSLPHREVLTLFFLEDLTIEEIAEVVQAPAGTVKSRLHYARQALRRALEREGS
jgi:RNA polymerase sigma-70 factor (ECF subfamily)